MGDFGWKPSILTVKPVRVPRWDYGPLKEIPEDTEIRRTESLDTNRLAYIVSSFRKRRKKDDATKGESNTRPSNALFRGMMDFMRRWVLIPDDRAGWYPFALREGRKWLREAEFDLIYTTCFPNVSHLVGRKLSEEFNLPMVADYRDIWIGNYYFYDPATNWHDRKQRSLEREVVERASTVISCTGPITEDFYERYPDIPKDKFETITNGFDPEDFRDVSPENDPDVFTITFTGTLYGSTSPKAFLQAVAFLVRRYPRYKETVRLRFMGTMIEPYRAMIDRYGLSDITRLDPYLSHGEAIQGMVDADLLLLLVAATPGSHIMLTQKVFEYVAARRPVLAIVPDGAARDFLEDLGEGLLVYPDGPKRIAKVLYQELLDWEKNGRKELPENSKSKLFERRELVKRMCECFDRAIGETTS